MDRAQIDRTQLKKPNCMACQHLMEGDDQLYCPIFNERILFPAIAAIDCPAYVPPVRFRCNLCQQPIRWQECPTGGWWLHERHPAVDHDAECDD